MNLGQLSRLVRAEFLVDAKSLTKVQGLPFRAAEIEAAIEEMIEAERRATATAVKLGRKDFQSDQEVRWCPGCGDYSILAAMQLLFAEIGVRPENLVFVSGIGCAARFPYYMNTYGIHSIHGRAPAVATGVALARPDLDVWVIGGDGDMLSIGGNHLIHALRRNVEHQDRHVQQPDLRAHQGPVLADERGRQDHEVVAVRLARPPVQPGVGRARRRGHVRRPAPTTWTAST